MHPALQHGCIDHFSFQVPALFQIEVSSPCDLLCQKVPIAGLEKAKNGNDNETFDLFTRLIVGLQPPFVGSKLAMKDILASVASQGIKFSKKLQQDARVAENVFRCPGGEEVLVWEENHFTCR